MLSFRVFSRAVPRFSRSVARSSLRPVALPKPGLQPWQAAKPAYAAFSTSRAFREPAAEGKFPIIVTTVTCFLYPAANVCQEHLKHANVCVFGFMIGDLELLAKLDEEVKHEKASGLEDAREQKASIDYALQAGEWQAKSIEGEQEVILTKKFGNETYVVEQPISWFCLDTDWICHTESRLPLPSLTSTTLLKTPWMSCLTRL